MFENIGFLIRNMDQEGGSVTIIVTNFSLQFHHYALLLTLNCETIIKHLETDRINPLFLFYGGIV